MSVEDKRLGREVMRELNRRRNIDVSDVRMNVMRGIVYIGGLIRPAVGEYLDPKSELKAINDAVRRVPGVRDLIIDAKFEMATKR